MNTDKFAKLSNITSTVPRLMVLDIINQDNNTINPNYRGIDLREINSKCEYSESYTSRVLKDLISDGAVTKTKKGHRVYYRIVNDDVVRLLKFLDSLGG